MPFVRISLRKDQQLETKNAISVAIHQSLISQFYIPEDDYFQVIEDLEHHQIRYPKNYLGIPHTDDILFIQITAGAGRTPEQKSRLYAEIAERISSTTTIKSDDIIIILVENNGSENWSFGQGKQFTTPIL